MTGPLGKMVVDGEHATLIFERRISHPITAVWAAIADPEQRAVWLGATTIDPREGGLIETLSDGAPAPAEARRMTGRILVWDPPRVLEHEWKQALVGDTVVRYELMPDGDATILRFTHSRLTERNAQGYRPGWHAYLDRFEAQLNGTELPRWMDRYGELQPAYVE